MCCTVLCLCTGHEDSVESAGFSRHLPLAATGSIDGKLIVWDCGTFTERGVCQHDDVSSEGATAEPGIVLCKLAKPKHPLLSQSSVLTAQSLSDGRNCLLQLQYPKQLE